MKKVGVPETPEVSALETSSRDPLEVDPPPHLVFEPVGVEFELVGVAVHVVEVEFALVGHQRVVHLPEGALRRRRLARLRRQLGVRVDVLQRQVAEDVAQAAAVVHVEQFADRRLGAAAVGALEVGVLDQGDGAGRVAADVVALRVDVVGEVDDRVGGAAQLLEPPRLRDQDPGAAEDDEARRSARSGRRRARRSSLRRARSR